MRIYGPNGTSALATTPTARRSAAGTFSLEQAASPRATTQTASVRTFGGIDALIAMQGFEEPPERRRRAVKRARSALDALDELKLGLLSGSLDTAALARLRSAALSLSERSGEEGLDAVLAEIELRVEVELAKLGMPQPTRNEAR